MYTMREPAVVLFLLTIIVCYTFERNALAVVAEEEVCDVAFSSAVAGTLRPSDILPPKFLQGGTNSTMELSIGRTQQLGRILVKQNNFSKNPAELLLLPSLVERETVQQMLHLLRTYNHTLDRDPDTVDAMPTYELFLLNPALGNTLSKDDNHPARQTLRAKLLKLVQPVLDERLTPLVQQHYPSCRDANGTSSRFCRPCYSLIRRYRETDRLSHAVHHDGHALVTAVISLSDHGVDYRGGLYVPTVGGEKRYIPLTAGDAVLHQFHLKHGVQVLPNEDDDDVEKKTTERWSWIVWYRDSESCQDHSSEWFQKYCDGDDPVCWHLQSTVDDPELTTEAEQSSRIIKLNKKAAYHGVGLAAMKVGRGYAHWLPSPLPYNLHKAREYFELAVDAKDPEGYYGLANLDLMKEEQNEVSLMQIVSQLEQSALLGHSYSMFNLGIAHTYGYGTANVKVDLAIEWLVASGLPEGLILAASIASDEHQKRAWTAQARALGYGQRWRPMVRDNTGSGGAGGVNLNLPWPAASDSSRPPQF
jgi:hypothetical protein